MEEKTSYLHWLVKNTATTWWHDSADKDELALALKYGATGVTTNPVLNIKTLRKDGAKMFPELNQPEWRTLATAERSEWLTSIVVQRAARTMESEFKRSAERDGYVCAQVNPLLAGNREKMLAMARRFSKLGPNIAVKLPATSAGMDVLEQCIGEDITCTMTVSFTVSQVLAAAEHHARGIHIAAQKGTRAGRCFSVIMIGRVDDYLREIVADTRASVTEEMIRQAGLAIVKRAYGLLVEKKSQVRLCVAALRGTYHMTEIAGGDFIMSIHPKYQEPFRGFDIPCEIKMDHPLDKTVINHLMKVPEFVRAYEPDGLRPEEYISYGLTQRTLSQFSETGWNPLETFSV